MRRVVVTGLGMVTPVGHDVAKTWSAICEGRPGVAPIRRFDASAFASRIGAEVKDFDLSPYLSPKEARKSDDFVHFGIAAAVQAVEESGLRVTPENAGRIGVAVGSGIGGLSGIEKGHLGYQRGGPRKISPFFVPANIINMIAGNLSIRYGIRGPNYGIVSACSTGTHNIGSAARMIERSDVDVMIAGGAEMATSPMGLGGFAAARALSTRNDEPERASRPWDRERDGFVLGDGAGVLVLEECEHAKARGAHIHAELAGYGMNSDAYHITLPSPDGEGAKQCMQLAMEDAGLNPEDIDYVNAHGTSTPAGDVVESNAMKACLGDHAYRVAISSTKSMIGHLLGAAGGVEAIFSILSIRDGVVPPTINLDEADEACDLDYVPHIARDRKVDVSMSNSFGFGGTNGTLVFKRFH